MRNGASLPVPSNKSVTEFSRESSREASAETPAVRQQVTLKPSIKASGSPATAIYAFMAYYVLCMGVCWWFYARKGAEVPC